MRFLEKQPLSGSSFLELGCGSGAVALYAAKLGARVTAIDINPAAVACTQQNALANGIDLAVFQSDLFSGLGGARFQKIVINPPYYPKNAQTDAEKAFFCGEGFEYYQQLFAQLPLHLERGALTWMILSEDCDIQRIKSMATSKGFSWEKVFTTTVWAEENYIFLLKKEG